MRVTEGAKYKFDVGYVYFSQGICVSPQLYLNCFMQLINMKK